LDFSKIKRKLSCDVGKRNRLLSVPEKLRVRLSKIGSIVQHFWKKKQAQVSTANKPYICLR
jgi:hypothetical protein